MPRSKLPSPAVSDAIREHMRKIAAKGGASRSAAKVAAVRLNLERANAARLARKA